jgi:hypothetical protein
MVGHSMAPFMGLVAEGFRGVEVVAGYSVAGEGSVVGSGKEWVAWGPSMESMGINQNFFLKVDPPYSHYTLSLKNAGTRRRRRK